MTVLKWKFLGMYEHAMDNTLSFCRDLNNTFSRQSLEDWILGSKIRRGDNDTRHHCYIQPDSLSLYNLFTYDIVG